MNTTTQKTYDQVFQHPITHNLEWRDIRAMFENLGEVEDEHNGNLKVVMAGQTVVFHSPNKTNMATIEEVNKIRHFLQNSLPIKMTGDTGHVLLVIDHEKAQVYRTEMNDSVPEKITPYDTKHHKAHVHNTHDDATGRHERPNHDAYFEEILQSLSDASQILIFGSGDGSSSEMDRFVTWINQHHQKVSDRIIGTAVVDQSHLTEGQLLRKAREMYKK